MGDGLWTSDDQKQSETIEQILLDAGITSREDLVSRFDKRKGVEGLKGIGPKRRKLLQAVLSESEPYFRWKAHFSRIPLHASIEAEPNGTEAP